MKKIISTLGLVVFLISFSGMAFAADALFRMLHADEVESFREDQDAFIVGQLADKKDGKFKVDVLKVVSGKVGSDSILVSDDFHYGWGETGPAINDYCVMSLKRAGNFYKKAWGIFKADGGDYRTLKLMPVNSKSPGLSADLACIEWYVNSGGTEKEFSFKEGNAFIKRPNGEVIQIYPKAASPKTTITATNLDTENMQPGFSLRPILIGVAAIIVILGMLFFKRLRK